MKLRSLAIGLAIISSFAFSEEKKDPKIHEDKIIASVPKKPLAELQEERKLLIFSVTNAFRHECIEVGELAMSILGKESGGYVPVVSNDLANFEPGKIEEFDAICFLNTTGNPFLPANFKELEEAEKAKAREVCERLKESMMSHIKNGAGFVGIHAATDTFYDWPEYGEMINGYFWGHPWNADDEVQVMIEPGQEDHPLVAHLGGENLVITEEIYQFKEPYDSSKVRMLLRLDPVNNDYTVDKIRRDDRDFGISWVRPWGKGRVFYSSFGHNESVFWNPAVMEHFLAGIQYAMGDLEAEDTPSEGGFEPIKE